jgi:hypothetical protein
MTPGMNNWIVRGLLLGLLLSSITIRATLGNDAGVSVPIEESVLHFMASRGFSYRGTNSIIDGEALDVMVFDTPSCGRPLQVAMSSAFRTNAFFDHIGAPDDARIFAYLDRVSRQADSRGMFFGHAKQRALELVGMMSYEPDGMMVMISEPEGCDIASRIDWTMLWKKDFRSRVASDRAASRQQNEPVTR